MRRETILNEEKNRNGSNQIFEIHYKDFIDFLIEAKKKTYAGQGRKIRRKDTSRHYIYEKYQFRYHDTYYGNLVDCGREVVYFQNKPVWAMCYHGGIVEGFEEESKEVFSFLREALLEVPSEFPLRGPQVYIKENYMYINQYSGNLFNFSGKEIIVSKSNKLVYSKNYCGGLVKDRSYKFLIRDEMR